MQRKLKNEEFFHPYFFEQGNDGQWLVWLQRPFLTPIIVTSFQHEMEAKKHAIHLNEAHRSWK